MSLLEYLNLSDILTTLTIAFVTGVGSMFSRHIPGTNTRLNVRSSSIELIEKVLNEKEWKTGSRKLVVEEAFERFYSKPLSFSEINILLSSESPNCAFRTYLKYRPATELSEGQNYFRFRKNRRPYWVIQKRNKSLFIPKEATKGILFYLVFASPASFLTTLIQQNPELISHESDMIVFLFFVTCLWFLAVYHLIRGLKYQASEKELKKNLGENFNETETPDSSSRDEDARHTNALGHGEASG